MGTLASVASHPQKLCGSAASSEQHWQPLRPPPPPHNWVTVAPSPLDGQSTVPDMDRTKGGGRGGEGGSNIEGCVCCPRRSWGRANYGLVRKRQWGEREGGRDTVSIIYRNPEMRRSTNVLGALRWGEIFWEFFFKRIFEGCCTFFEMMHHLACVCFFFSLSFTPSSLCGFCLSPSATFLPREKEGGGKKEILSDLEKENVDWSDFASFPLSTVLCACVCVFVSRRAAELVLIQWNLDTTCVAHQQIFVEQCLHAYQNATVPTVE